MKNIVFDLGKVLIDWQPELAFRDHFADPADIAPWMQRVDFDGWNRLQDGGRSLGDGLAAARAQFGDDAAPLETYVQHFPRTITRPMPGTWELIELLDASEIPLFAITNWSADNWPAAMAQYPRLGTIFRDIVVSGQVGMLKPDAGIYELLMNRNGLQARDCLFIDDSVENVQGAAEIGMKAIRFTSAEDLSERLEKLGLLGPRYSDIRVNP